MYIYENGQVKLKDIPIWRGTTHIWNFFIHRYQCNCCHETFTEKIHFKYPGTRITYRAANWIKGFLQQKMSIKAIQELTGIHWDTIRKVQREIMDEAIWKREKMLREEGYQADVAYEHIYRNGDTFVGSKDGSLELGPQWEELKKE